MESLFEQLLHRFRLAVEERERELRVAARTDPIFPAGAHPARA